VANAAHADTSAATISRDPERHLGACAFILAMATTTPRFA
jgi:hypothetical protein